MKRLALALSLTAVGAHAASPYLPKPHVVWDAEDGMQTTLQPNTYAAMLVSASGNGNDWAPLTGTGGAAVQPNSYAGLLVCTANCSSPYGQTWSPWTGTGGGGGGGGVTSYNTRTGAVVPAAGDYPADFITTGTLPEARLPTTLARAYTFGADTFFGGTIHATGTTPKFIFDVQGDGVKMGNSDSADRITIAPDATWSGGTNVCTYTDAAGGFHCGLTLTSSAATKAVTTATAVALGVTNSVTSGAFGLDSGGNLIIYRAGTMAAQFNGSNNFLTANLSSLANSQGSSTADCLRVGSGNLFRALCNGNTVTTQVIGGGSAATVAAGAAAGTTPGTPTYTGTNIAGVLTVITGTATTTGTLATVTFNGTLGTAPQGCQLTPRNAATAPTATSIYTTAPSTTAWTVAASSALTASTTYSWSVICE